MKVLSVHDLKPEDSLLLTFDGAFSPQAALERELEPLLQALEEYADGWMPDVVNGKRQRKYARPAIWKALEERLDGNRTALGLYRTKWPALDSRLRLWIPPRQPELGIILQVKPLSFFAEAERCRRFVELVRAWTSRYPVTYAMAHSTDDRALAGAPNFGRDDEALYRDGFDKIYEVFWLNVFGPKLAETVGRERTADSALPPDVEDMESARKHYSTLAEHLVALLHTEVPSVFEATPESPLPRGRAAPEVRNEAIQCAHPRATCSH